MPNSTTNIGVTSGGPDILKRTRANTEQETFTYIWKIENFSQLRLAIGQNIQSPTFTTYNNTAFQFKMLFYPAGEQVEELETAATLYVHLYPTDPVPSAVLDDIDAQVHVCVPSSSLWRVRDLVSRMIKKNPRISRPTDPHYYANFKRLVRLDSMRDESHGYLKDDVLTITCEVSERINYPRLSTTVQVLYTDISRDLKLGGGYQFFYNPPR